jgi:hypothetical protein
MMHRTPAKERHRAPFTLQSRGVSLERSFRLTTRKALQGALGRLAKRLRRVGVWLEDTNGPREGSGIRCRIDMLLASGGHVVVSAEAPEPHAAVSRCAVRARTHLDRLIKRRRSILRRRRFADAARR